VTHVHAVSVLCKRRHMQMPLENHWDGLNSSTVAFGVAAFLYQSRTTHYALRSQRTHRIILQASPLPWGLTVHC
jgi:hypothetical protein